MAPNSLILRVYRAKACADLLGILCSQDRPISDFLLIEHIDFQNLFHALQNPPAWLPASFLPARRPSLIPPAGPAWLHIWICIHQTR